jgi:hypothetical protein
MANETAGELRGAQARAGWGFSIFTIPIGSKRMQGSWAARNLSMQIDLEGQTMLHTITLVLGR